MCHEQKARSLLECLGFVARTHLVPERGEGQEVAAVVERDARSREMTRKGRDGSGEKDGRACFACSWGGNVYFLLGGGGCWSI